VSEPIVNQNGNGHANGTAKSNGHAKTDTANGRSSHRKTGQQDIAALIDQATKLRSVAHDLMHQTAELVKSLKQHRRQSRVVANTLASLRALKGLRV
jgi:hypothetical protein